MNIIKKIKSIFSRKREKKEYCGLWFYTVVSVRTGKYVKRVRGDGKCELTDSLDDAVIFESEEKTTAFMDFHGLRKRNSYEVKRLFR